MRALLLLCLLAPAASAQTAMERLDAARCSVNPGLSVDADGLLRVGNPAEPDSVEVCLVSFERSPGGVVTLRMRTFLPYAVLRPLVDAMTSGIAAELGDTETDLDSANEPIARLLSHAVAFEVEQSVRCSTGDVLQTSGGVYDLTGTRLMDTPVGFDQSDMLAGPIRRYCEAGD